MRLDILLTLSLCVSTSFGQKPDVDKNDNSIYPHLPNCVNIINDKPIKAFLTNDIYIGKVVIEARLDTATMTLKEHKFVFVNLHSIANPGKKIQLRQNNQNVDIKYLDSLLPELVGHLKYLKFKITLTEDCILSTYLKFPITIKRPVVYR